MVRRNSLEIVCAASLLVIATISTPANAQERQRGGLSTVEGIYQENCAVCHGEQLQGAPQGTPLAGQPLMHGESTAEIIASISRGAADKGMPAWQQVLSEHDIKSLALWIGEHRDGLLYSDFRLTAELTIPDQVISTQHNNIRVQPFVSGLDPLPYSITPLPDGSIILAEKMRGLRVISPTGEISDIITGTPKVYDDVSRTVDTNRLSYGMGWLLEVAAHPNYAENGWIYLHYTNRCEDCNAVSRESKRPVSMNALMRGRIKDGVWVDQEVLWEPGEEHYGPITDVAAGGRIAFDPEGYVYISVGMKNATGTQDLAWPGGKIHRIHDDGRIPSDNPFVDHPTARKSIWSYGHRSPQGLEFNTETRQLWGTEHGPRGGDEINLLLPGRNYGWPMFSKGQNYDGTEVAFGRETGEVELSDIEQPIVDWTPSPAVSAFVFYGGNVFPDWQGDLIVGSLKATDLYRVRIKDGVKVEEEKIVENLARIRDVEVAANGEVLLLLEHASGGQIVKVVPAGDLAQR